MLYKSEKKEKSETKKKIFNVAVQLFAQNGYDATTVRQIAKGADVSQPSLYWAFKDKQAILTEILSTYIKKVEKNLVTKEEADKLIETDTPRQLLERCTIFFKEDETEFMFLAYKIACMEQFTNQLAKEIIIGESRKKAVERLKYVLDLLIARGKIPKVNTTFLTELWAQSWLYDSAMWVHFVDEGKAEGDINFKVFNKQIIDVALNGCFPVEEE